MNNFEKIRNKKVSEIIISLKVVYILLCIVSVVSNNGLTLEMKNIIILYAGTCIVSLLIIIYFSWVYYYRKDYINNSPKLIDIIETIFLVVIFVVAVVSTGAQASYYKLVSIFIVLIGAIQFGKNYSIALAVVSSLSILFIDIVASSPNMKLLSKYFENDLVLISALFMTAFILGMYVDTERQHSKELKELVNKDELTGLYNHRYFQDYLQNNLEDAQKQNKQVSLLFMDIDYFKNYNDINGHQSGDLLLKQIGKILKDSIRENDVVARYGGEEFAAILPNTDEENAIEIGEKIRSAIQNTEFVGQENQPNKNITISIGVSSYPTRAISKHQLINTADDALYRAKSFNKNRVESYHSVLDDLCKRMDIKEDTIKSLKTFINMINLKDRYTYGHTERVVIYVKWFAQMLKLKEEDQAQIQIAAYLHDIGKLEIPEEVLNKKGRLTNTEFQMFKDHPEVGVGLIQNIKPFESFVPLIKYHHERYDGGGYPDGLKGQEIPYLARMLTIADSFDAMTSNRPYNVRKSHEEGIEELRLNAGLQFDPELVEIFIEMLEKYKENF